MMKGSVNVTTYFDLFSLLAEEARACLEAGDEATAQILAVAAQGVGRSASSSAVKPLRIVAKFLAETAADGEERAS